MFRNQFKCLINRQLSINQRNKYITHKNVGVFLYQNKLTHGFRHFYISARRTL